MQTDELVAAVAALRERKARERCIAIGENPDSGVTPWADDREAPAKLWQIYASSMDDMMAIIPLVLEHAAKVAEADYAPAYGDPYLDGQNVASNRIAAAIRQVQP